MQQVHSATDRRELTSEKWDPTVATIALWYEGVFKVADFRGAAATENQGNHIET